MSTTAKKKDGAPAKAAKASAKPAAKDAKAKAAAPSIAAKKPAKPAAKAVKPAAAKAKTAAKPPAKPTAKPAAKAKPAAPAKTKAAPKPTAKAAPKAAPKPKAVTKPAAKATAKPASKPKAAPAKTKAAPPKAAPKGKPAAKAPSALAQSMAARKVQQETAKPAISVHIGPRRPALSVAPGAMVVGRRPPVKRPAPEEQAHDRRLGKRELAEIKDRLLHRQEMLLAAMKHELKVQRENSGPKVADEVDKATDAYDEDLSFEIATANDQELQELQVALDKLARGTYGLCEVCHCPISASRLRVLPFATTCVSCRGQEELQRRHEEEGTTFNLLGDETDADEAET